MKRLRFADARVKLLDAAVLLATNQEPWASVVHCSLYDFAMTRFHYPSIVVAVMYPMWSSSALFESDQLKISTDPMHHRVLIEVDRNCPEGEVRLPRPGARGARAPSVADSAPTAARRRTRSD